MDEDAGKQRSEKIRPSAAISAAQIDHEQDYAHPFVRLLFFGRNGKFERASLAIMRGPVGLGIGSEANVLFATQLLYILSVSCVCLGQGPSTCASAVEA